MKSLIFFTDKKPNYSPELLQAIEPAMQNVSAALERGSLIRCSKCRKMGATFSCCRRKCKTAYHLHCIDPHSEPKLCLSHALEDFSDVTETRFVRPMRLLICRHHFDEIPEWRHFVSLAHTGEVSTNEGCILQVGLENPLHRLMLAMATERLVFEAKRPVYEESSATYSLKTLLGETKTFLKEEVDFYLEVAPTGGMEAYAAGEDDGLEEDFAGEAEEQFVAEVSQHKSVAEAPLYEEVVVHAPRLEQQPQHQLLKDTEEESMHLESVAESIAVSGAKRPRPIQTSDDEADFEEDDDDDNASNSITSAKCSTVPTVPIKRKKGRRERSASSSKSESKTSSKGHWEEAPDGPDTLEHDYFDHPTADLATTKTLTVIYGGSSAKAELLKLRRLEWLCSLSIRDDLPLLGNLDQLLSSAETNTTDNLSIFAAEPGEDPDELEKHYKRNHCCISLCDDWEVLLLFRDEVPKAVNRFLMKKKILGNVPPVIWPRSQDHYIVAIKRDFFFDHLASGVMAVNSLGLAANGSVTEGEGDSPAVSSSSAPIAAVRYSEASSEQSEQKSQRAQELAALKAKQVDIAQRLAAMKNSAPEVPTASQPSDVDESSASGAIRKKAKVQTEVDTAWVATALASSDEHVCKAIASVSLPPDDQRIETFLESVAADRALAMACTRGYDSLDSSDYIEGRLMKAGYCSDEEKETAQRRNAKKPLVMMPRRVPRDQQPRDSRVSRSPARDYRDSRSPPRDRDQRDFRSPTRDYRGSKSPTRDPQSRSPNRDRDHRGSRSPHRQQRPRSLSNDLSHRNNGRSSRSPSPAVSIRSQDSRSQLKFPPSSVACRFRNSCNRKNCKFNHNDRCPLGRGNCPDVDSCKLAH